MSRLAVPSSTSGEYLSTALPNPSTTMAIDWANNGHAFPRRFGPVRRGGKNVVASGGAWWYRTEHNKADIDKIDAACHEGRHFVPFRRWYLCRARRDRDAGGELPTRTRRRPNYGLTWLTVDNIAGRSATAVIRCQRKPYMSHSPARQKPEYPYFPAHSAYLCACLQGDDAGDQGFRHNVSGLCCSDWLLFLQSRRK